VVKSASWAPVNVRERIVTDPAVVLVTVTSDGADLERDLRALERARGGE
jgi:hypothetical protein